MTYYEQALRFFTEGKTADAVKYFVYARNYGSEEEKTRAEEILMQIKSSGSVDVSAIDFSKTRTTPMTDEMITMNTNDDIPDELSENTVYLPKSILEHFAKKRYENAETLSAKDILDLKDAYKCARQEQSFSYDKNHDSWCFPLKGIRSFQNKPMKAAIKRSEKSYDLPWIVVFIGEDFSQPSSKKRGKNMLAPDESFQMEITQNNAEDGLPTLKKNLEEVLRALSSRANAEGWILLADVGLLYSTMTGNKLKTDVTTLSRGQYKTLREYCASEEAPFELARNHASEEMIRIVSTEQKKKKAKSVSALKKSAQTQNEGLFRATLSNYVSSYYIFLDTCAFQHQEFSKFFDTLHPILVEKQKSLYTLSSVLEELKSNAKVSNKNPQRAKFALEKIRLLEETGKIKIVDSSQQQLPKASGAPSHFADPVFLSMVRTRKSREPLLIVTQDTALANDLMRTNEETSMKGKFVCVCKIDGQGRLVLWDPSSSTIGELNLIGWNEPLD